VGSDEGVSPENLLAFDREENLRQFEQKYLLNPVNKPNNERLSGLSREFEDPKGSLL